MKLSPFEIAVMAAKVVMEGGDIPRQEADRYRALGWLVVKPGTPAGSRFGFHGRDWHDDSFFAVNGSLVEIPFIHAKRQRTGAFTRLRDGLEAQGFNVVIVCPLGGFRDALARAGYECTTVGKTLWERRDLWHRSDER